MGKHTVYDSGQPGGLEYYLASVAEQTHMANAKVSRLLARMYVDVAGMKAPAALDKAARFLDWQVIDRFDAAQSEGETTTLRCRMIGHGAVVGLCWPNSELDNSQLEGVLDATRLALGSFGHASALTSSKGIVHEQLRLAAIPRLDALPVQNNKSRAERDHDLVIFSQLNDYEIIRESEFNSAKKLLA